jgi:hypothetical protein
VRLGVGGARRHRHVALSREPFDELARDDLFDGARRTLDLDPVIALQQRDDLLARSVEQLRDLINPDCGH